MRIRERLSQHRRDFIAIYECESCGATKRDHGYDDAHFHQNVVPDMSCEACGAKAPTSYLPVATRHPEGEVV